MKRFISLFLVAFVLSGLFCSNAYASNKSNTRYDKDTPITRENLWEYQLVLDKLNEEYGFSAQFAPELFTNPERFISPFEFTLEEYEADLRKEFESIIKEEQESKERIAALGDVEWKELPMSGFYYLLKDNVNPRSYYTMSNINAPSEYIELPEDLYTIVVYDEELYAQYLKNNGLDNSDSANIQSQAKATSESKTISSIQSRYDPDGNAEYRLNSTIKTTPNWYYASVQGITPIYTSSSNVYILTRSEYTIIDGGRTVSVTLYCNYYNSKGSLSKRDCVLNREYHVAGDCFTNSPNYTIETVETNKTYNHISDYTNSQNCAGYAWGYPAYVTGSTLGLTVSELSSCSTSNDILDLVRSKSESYMSQHGIVQRRIGNYTARINASTSYRVVLRTGYIDINNNGHWDTNDIFDYHWWMQLGDGSWADKRGGYPSRIIPNSNITQNPDLLLWSIYDDQGGTLYSDFYNSTPQYYVITG